MLAGNAHREIREPIGAVQFSGGHPAGAGGQGNQQRGRERAGPVAPQPRNDAGAAGGCRDIEMSVRVEISSRHEIGRDRKLDPDGGEERGCTARIAVDGGNVAAIDSEQREVAGNDTRDEVGYSILVEVRRRQRKRGHWPDLERRDGWSVFEPDRGEPA